MDEKQKTDMIDGLKFTVSQLYGVNVACMLMHEDGLISKTTMHVTQNECTEAKRRIRNLIENLEK